MNTTSLCPTAVSIRRLFVKIIATLAVGVAIALAIPLAEPASAADAVVLRARIDNRDLATVDNNSPLKLRPDHLTGIAFDVANNSARPILVHSIRLDGRVMNLSFFSYETVIDVPVAPNSIEHREINIDLLDLAHQATGLLPARLALLGPDRSVIASTAFPVNIAGSGRSVYGTFGLVVALLTIVLMASAVWRLVAHRLDANRWKRGARFGVAGLALGLTLTFALSSFGMVVPSAGSWTMVVVVCGGILFLMGELTPAPQHALALVTAQPTIDLRDRLRSETAASTASPVGVLQGIGASGAAGRSGPTIRTPNGPAPKPHP